MTTHVFLIGAIILTAICAVFILDRRSIIMVHCWKTLLVTILFGGGMFLYRVIDMITGKVPILYNETEFVMTIVVIIFWGYVILKGLWVAFTGDGLVEEKLEQTLYKMACQNLFGPLSLIAPWGGVILIILAALSVEVIPSPNWVSILLLIGGLAYQFRVYRLIRKHIKMEKDKGAVY